eukprot:339490_1
MTSHSDNNKQDSNGLGLFVLAASAAVMWKISNRSAERSYLKCWKRRVIKHSNFLSQTQFESNYYSIYCGHFSSQNSVNSHRLYGKILTILPDPIPREIDFRFNTMIFWDIITDSAWGNGGTVEILETIGFIPQWLWASNTNLYENMKENLESIKFQKGSSSMKGTIRDEHIKSTKSTIQYQLQSIDGIGDKTMVGAFCTGHKSKCRGSFILKQMENNILTEDLEFAIRKVAQDTYLHGVASMENNETGAYYYLSPIKSNTI